MTQAFNLSQFANKVNTSGQADLTTAVTGTLPVANGGTGATTLTANNVLLGNGTSAPLTVAPSTSGNVLTSNGTTWVSSSPTGGGGGGGQVFTANGTFTIPTGITRVKVTLVGGGGGSGGGSPSSCGASITGGGGGGATAIKFLTGLTSGNTLSVTVGSAGTAGSAGGTGGTGGSSTIASGTQTITTVTAGGGGGGGGISDGTVTTIASGGTATNGDINITGGRPSVGSLGSYATLACGGTSTFSNSVGATSSSIGSSGYGMGGQGLYVSSTSSGKAGSAGLVLIEW